MYKAVLRSKVPGVGAGIVELTHAVIWHLYKLMAYNDEYEVVGLCLKQAWKDQLGVMFVSLGLLSVSPQSRFIVFGCAYGL